MPDDEFTETPYAASFGPVPGVYSETPEPLDISSLQPPMNRAEPSPEPFEETSEPGEPPAPSQAAQTRHTSRRNLRNNLLPSLESIVIDENMTQSLVAAEKLSAIGLDDTQQWDDTIETVIGGLRSLQTKWSILEVERKKLAKPISASGQSGMTRGVRRRGRGRGRRRGRWRAV